MLPALQPTRPSLPATRRVADPRHQQQIRPASINSQPGRPQSQIEAMPPHLAPTGLSRQANTTGLPIYNPALVHPVFFTTGWRKIPYPLPSSPSVSPAATGYMFNTPQRAASATKL